MQKRVAPRIRHHRILVVDDEPDLREIIRLNFANFDCMLAGDGCEALDILAEDSRFDWILTDVQMPRMTGTALYREIVERYPRLARRFVFMTGSALTDPDHTLLRSLAWSNRIYTKPFSVADLALDLAGLRREAMLA